MRVWTAGRLARATSCRSNGAAPAEMTPPPKYTRGRLASLRTAAACSKSVCSGFGGVSAGAGERGVNSQTAVVRSLGMSTSTGPFRPLWAMRKAARMVSARSSTRRTVTECLVTGIAMPSM